MAEKHQRRALRRITSPGSVLRFRTLRRPTVHGRTIRRSGGLAGAASALES